MMMSCRSVLGRAERLSTVPIIFRIIIWTLLDRFVMAPHEDDFGPYLEGEDEIECTYSTPDEFEAAMRSWIQKE